MGSGIVQRNARRQFENDRSPISTLVKGRQAGHADVSKFAGLYVMLSQMRILSSQAVVENAEKIINAIAKEYFEPNRTLREMYGKTHELDEELDIMRHFSEACREDLKGRGSI